MADPSAPRPGRRWAPAALLAALGLALMGFGGVVLPRMATDGVPASLAQPRADDLVVVRGKRGHKCRRDEFEHPPPAPPAFLSPADR
jgi:hypothetical protein